MGVGVSIAGISKSMDDEATERGKKWPKQLHARIPRIVVGIPPLILSGEGIDGAGPGEAEGGTKALADEIRIFRRNPRSGEVAAT